MKIYISDARTSFANGLFTASAMEDGQTPKFGADFILEPGVSTVFKVVDGKKVPTTMDAIMLEVANDTWKGKGKAMLDALEASKKCYRNGNTRLKKDGEPYAGYEGNMYVTAKNKSRPTVLNRDKSALTEEDGVIYSGCYVHASIEIYGMSDPKRKGVHATLGGVMFSKDGEAFGGGAPASASDFDDIGDIGADDFM